MPEDGDRGFSDRWRELAGIDASLHADAVAKTDALVDTFHENEDAFLGILDEEQRPGRIEEGDDAGDADVTADRRGVDSPDLGNARQRGTCRLSDRRVGDLVTALRGRECGARRREAQGKRTNPSSREHLTRQTVKELAPRTRLARYARGQPR